MYVIKGQAAAVLGGNLLCVHVLIAFYCIVQPTPGDGVRGIQNNSQRGQPDGHAVIRCGGRSGETTWTLWARVGRTCLFIVSLRMSMMDCFSLTHINDQLYQISLSELLTTTWPALYILANRHIGRQNHVSGTDSNQTTGLNRSGVMENTQTPATAVCYVATLTTRML